MPPGAARTVTNPPAQPAAAQAQPVTPVPQQPVLPPRPEQMAPVPPQVTYQNGQLSILAQNSTLSSILSAVKARTGAQVEMPPDLASDRVATQLGPGTPRDVLAALLQGSRFDYIFIGTPTDPDSLAQVIITQRTGAGGGAPVSTAAGQPMQGGGSPEPMPRMAGGRRPEITGDEEETASEPPPQPEPVQPQEAVPQPAPQTGQPFQPGQPLQPGATISPGGDRGDTGQQQNPNQQNPNQQNPNQVKTPEQLLQELQRMQQMQQQQQQQQQQQPPQQQQQQPPR